MDAAAKNLRAATLSKTARDYQLFKARRLPRVEPDEGTPSSSTRGSIPRGRVAPLAVESVGFLERPSTRGPPATGLFSPPTNPVVSCVMKIFLLAFGLLALWTAIKAVVNFLGRAGQAIVRIVLAVCVAGFAVAAGALASLLADHVLGEVTVLGLGGARWAGIATTCLLFGLAAYWHSRSKGEAGPPALDRAWSHVDRVAPVPISTPPPGPWWSLAARRVKKESHEDLARALAWDQLALHADWAAARIAVARGACEGYLRGLPPEPTLLEGELAIALRRRVPEIIAEMVEGCRGVTPSEARVVAEEGVELLELLAAEAERRRPVVDGRSRSRLATKRAYVEEVVRRGRPG